MRQVKANPASITVTSSASPRTPVQISGVTGVWARRDGSSHIEYGHRQLIAVQESPIRIERRLEVAGLPGPKHNDMTRLPTMRRATLRSKARAVYDWFRNPASSYDEAAANIDQAVRETMNEDISWERKSDTLYEGSRSASGRHSSGQLHTYLLEVAPDGHLSYDYSRWSYGAGSAPRRRVTVGRSPLGDATKDRYVQEKLGVLWDVAEVNAAERVIASSSKDIG